MDQNQNFQQPNMQDPQNYQYGYNQTVPGQNGQVNQANPYGQGYQANPYNQGAAPLNQQGYVQPDQFSQAYQQPMYAPVAVKKRINPAVIIIPIAAVVLAAVVVLMIILFSGNGGYQGAEKRYFNNMLDRFSSTMSKATDKAAQPQLITVNFDASNGQIADYIGISDITFMVETASRGDDIYALLSMEIGKEVLSGELWFNEKDGEMMFRLPDISSIYFQAGLDMEEAQASMIDTDKLYSALGDVIAKTLDTYFEMVGESEIKGGQSFRVDRETFTADKVVITLNQAQLLTLTKAFMENFIENDDIMDILCTYMDEDKDDVIELLGIDYAIEQMEDLIDELEDDEHDAIEMTVWMQGGNVVGREIELIDVSGNTVAEIAFYQVPTSKGSITYLEVADEFEILNRDEVSGGLHTGSLTVSASGYDVLKAEYEDLAVTDNQFQGEATIEFVGYDSFEIKIRMETDGDTKELEISVPNMFKVKITSEPSDLSFEGMPEPSRGQVVNITGNYDEDAMQDFIEDLSDYISKIDTSSELYSILMSLGLYW